MTEAVSGDGAGVALPPIPQRIADEIGVRVAQVDAAVALLDGGATVPFVARYRKEATDGLDDAQLRTLEERLTYLRELEERREAVLSSVREQGKLDDALLAQILAAETKGRLEDVYLPYKPKRRTKAQIAREAGLEPLADGLVADPTVIPRAAAHAFVDPERGVSDTDAALEGARAILVERWTEDADLIAELRERMWTRGRLRATVREGRGGEGDTTAAKFSDYFAFDEAFTRLPSHRILAVLRGESEEILSLQLDPLSTDDDDYAAAKRGGEMAVEQVFGERSLLARAGLILGPFERVGRLPWWLDRIARGGRVLAPGPPERPLQYVDARDLASWLLDAGERRVSGAFNAVSAVGHTTIGELLTACVAVTGADAELVWLSPEAIAAAGVAPWTELPIWVPPTGELAGLHAGDVSAALRDGLRCRPVDETVRDTWQWLQEEGMPEQPAERAAPGLDPEREREILASAG